MGLEDGARSGNQGSYAVTLKLVNCDLSLLDEDGFLWRNVGSTLEPGFTGEATQTTCTAFPFESLRRVAAAKATCRFWLPG